MDEKTYIAVDLKSFYASVECRERGLDPLATNLVVADESRTEKTICLAVPPPLKARGIPGRPRLFEVIRKVSEINAARKGRAPGYRLTGSSCDDRELRRDPALSLDYIVAPPRMALYIEYSTRIYEIYLKYFSPEDILVYSIDEVFIDATGYLDTYGMSARKLTMKVIRDVLQRTGITATAGIGTNLFLCKTAMDIKAKRIPPDRYGVRIAELDEKTYREEMWGHTPITDFWRVGKGYAGKLEEHGLYTMGDIARCSVGKPDEGHDEELLYRLFGVNAELLIDHAWGWEPCTIEAIRAYRPSSRSLGSGQVLRRPYSYEEARLIVKEMTDSLALDLVDKGLVTDRIVLTIGYDIENLTIPRRRREYKGETRTDAYGRQVPRPAHGTGNLKGPTSSARIIMDAMLRLYERIVDPALLIRRVTLSADRLVSEKDARQKPRYEQLDFFDILGGAPKRDEESQAALEKERRMQQAMLGIRKKYGKNAILKGRSLRDGAMEKDRNEQIGGHKA